MLNSPLWQNKQELKMEKIFVNEADVWSWFTMI